MHNASGLFKFKSVSTHKHFKHFICECNDLVILLVKHTAYLVNYISITINDHRTIVF